MFWNCFYLFDISEKSVYTQWTTEEYPVNETISVRVLQVINPGLIYVIPTKAKGKYPKYIMLTKTFFSYCD